MTTSRPKLTLHQPVVYQIEVSGAIDADWSDWVSGLTITVTVNCGGQPVTVLTGEMDQAGLHGLLRRLYGVGLPLIAVRYVSTN